MPFAVRRLEDGRIVGATSVLAIDPAVPRIEIGSTWYAASAQRTGVNTEAKLLLLGQAFDGWGCVRVELKTHTLNARSRRAIERIDRGLHRLRLLSAGRALCVTSSTTILTNEIGQSIL